jgi:hypothetical protein
VGRTAPLAASCEQDTSCLEQLLQPRDEMGFQLAQVVLIDLYVRLLRAP